MKHKLLATLIILPLAGCSMGSLVPRQSEQFTVDSVPVGASVLVLGEAMGQTPMSLTTRSVFPQSFDHDKQHLYGRVELSYPGCDPFITSVSSRIIHNGLKARLTCHDKASAQESSPKTPPQEAAAISPPMTSEPQTGPDELKSRLLQLKELFKEGLISEQDYADKRRQLLKEL